MNSERSIAFGCPTNTSMVDLALYSILIKYYLLKVYLIPLLSFTVFLLFSIPGAQADAKVDGFFKEDHVTSGMFEQDRHISEMQVEKANKESFFITREERRRNPEKAPSNNIVIERPTVRVTQYPVLRYPVLPGVWVSSSDYELKRPGQGNEGLNYQQASPAQVSPAQAPIPPTILSPGDSFDVSEKYEMEGFGEEPEL